MSDSFARTTRGARDARDWGLTRRTWLKASSLDDVDLTSRSSASSSRGQTGDLIELDGRTAALVDDPELMRRRTAWQPSLFLPPACLP